ncbi:MAG: hypothetical protein EYC70_06020 [Planctomycetota bacterium]|nr:MAG: hypothetical protein EYC70_06020 [Planctomycetota bacterium]
MLPTAFLASLALSLAPPCPPAQQPHALDLSQRWSILEAQSVEELEPQTEPEPEYYENIYRRFGLNLGVAAYSDFNTSLTISTPTIVGAVIDLEDTLGVDRSTQIARIDAYYSFNRRHRIDASYYDIDRSGSRTLQDDIQVGDVFFPAGSGVETEFRTKILKLDYRYNFVADTRTTIGASIGFHVMGIGFGMQTNNLSLEENFRVNAPLPLLGLHFAYALDRKWHLSADWEVLKVDLGTFQGYVNDNRLTLEHDTFKNFGWGVGLNNFRTEVTVEGSGSPLDADIEYGYSGVMLYARLYF